MQLVNCVKVFFRLVFTICVGIAVVLLSANCRSDNPAAGQGDMKAKTTLKANIPQFAQEGDPVILNLGIHNFGATTIEVNQYKDIGEFNIIVTDSKGGHASLTDEGKTLLQMPSGAYRPIIIPSKMSHEWRYELTRLFVMKKGRYKVSVSVVVNRGRKDVQSEILRANEMNLEIQ